MAKLKKGLIKIILGLLLGFGGTILYTYLMNIEFEIFKILLVGIISSFLFWGMVRMFWRDE